MKETGFAFCKFCQKFFLLTLELTQYAVDQPFELGTFNRDSTFYRLSQRSMRWDAGMKKLIEANHNQIMDGTLLTGHWARHQLINQPFKLRKGAQDAKTELLKQSSVFVGHFLLQWR